MSSPAQPESRPEPGETARDAVRLTVPHTRDYYGVVRLVVGGLVARLDLPLESHEDVQLALESLVANEAFALGGEITVEVGVSDGGLEVVVGPLDAGRLDVELADESDRRGVGLGRVLATVAGDFDLERRDGGEWVRFRKEVRSGERAP